MSGPINYQGFSFTIMLYLLINSIVVNMDEHGQQFLLGAHFPSGFAPPKRSRPPDTYSAKSRNGAASTAEAEMQVWPIKDP